MLLTLPFPELGRKAKAGTGGNWQLAEFNSLFLGIPETHALSSPLPRPTHTPTYIHKSFAHSLIHPPKYVEPADYEGNNGEKDETSPVLIRVFCQVGKKGICPAMTVETDECEDQKILATWKHNKGASNLITGQERLPGGREVSGDPCEGKLRSSRTHLKSAEESSFKQQVKMQKELPHQFEA